MKNLHIIQHPLVKRDVTLLRDRRTTSNQFRGILRRVAILMAYEVTKDLPLRAQRVETPMQKTRGDVVAKPIVLVPVLRAGLGLVGGFIEVIPDARVGHIGLYRNEKSLKPVDYYFKVPNNLRNALVVLLDPMLATGGSAAAAISYLKRHGARHVVFASVIAAPEGVNTVRRSHPDVKMYTCALDRRLDDRGYILPGLGDAGDRIFGTE